MRSDLKENFIWLANLLGTNVDSENRRAISTIKNSILTSKSPNFSIQQTYHETKSPNNGNNRKKKQHLRGSRTYVCMYVQYLLTITPKHVL